MIWQVNKHGRCTNTDLLTCKYWHAREKLGWLYTPHSQRRADAGANGAVAPQNALPLLISLTTHNTLTLLINGTPDNTIPLFISRDPTQYTATLFFIWDSPQYSATLYFRAYPLPQYTATLYFRDTPTHITLPLYISDRVQIMLHPYTTTRT